MKGLKTLDMWWNIRYHCPSRKDGAWICQKCEKKHGLVYLKP
jgi:hypothetical protein